MVQRHVAAVRHDAVDEGQLARFEREASVALVELLQDGLRVRGAVISLTLDGNLAMLGYEVYLPNIEATDQVADGAMALLFNIMRSLCGPDWKPIEVQLSHRKPKDAAPFRQFFCVPPRFDAERNALVFSTRWLSRGLPDVDSELRRLLQQQADMLEARNGDGFSAQVRSVMRTAIVNGHADAKRVAALFSMHSRTLHRRLEASGTGFQVLVDESRFERARQLLVDSSMEVSRVAMLIGYADASAFTRAFKRWSGTTPARWRATRGTFAS